jgi:uncharacterized membrane protein
MELIVLRIIHVVGGIVWVGGAVLMAFFIAPALQSAGAAAGPIMGALQKRKFMVILPVIALLTMLSGLRLMMIMSSNFGEGYFRSPIGQTFSGAGLLAILAFVIGILVNRPTMIKLGTLQQSMASDGASKEKIAAEIKKLQGRMAMAGWIVTAMLLAAAVGMSIARYM